VGTETREREAHLGTGPAVATNAKRRNSTAEKYSNSAAAQRRSARLFHAQRASVRLTDRQAVTLQASGLPCTCPISGLGPMQGSRSGKAILVGYPLAVPKCQDGGPRTRYDCAVSSFGRSCLRYLASPERSTARLAGVNRRRRTF
jgi:hypothetical protein